MASNEDPTASKVHQKQKERPGHKPKNDSFL